MTPKEKTNELVEKFYKVYQVTYKQAIDCALIAVDEILNNHPILPSPLACKSLDDCIVQAKKFWQEVKQEIENL